MNRDLQHSDGFDVTFYVPCLNEAANVGQTLETLASAAASYDLKAEILVYDDGSTDATFAVAAEVLEGLERRHPTWHGEVIRLPSSRGLGANFFDGAERGRGERYMLVNGDFSERAETLDGVLSRLGEADIVTTFFDDGDVRGVLRRSLSRLFTFAVNCLNGHRLRYYNGPTLHRREDVVRFRTHCHGFAYQAELLTQQLDAGRSYIEVPMVNRQRGSGVTKAFAPSNLMSVAGSLRRIRSRRFRNPS